VTRLCALLTAAALLCGCAPAASAALPRFGHVFLIVGENTSYAELTASRAPYLTGTLRPRSAWFTHYGTFTQSSSLGQYVAMVSGQFTRCEENDALPAHCHQGVDNLFAQLAARGRTWRVWAESMPAPCFRRDAGQPSRHNAYTAHHNPALYFTRLRSACRASDLPMGGTGAKDTGAFDRALRRGRVGDFNVVVPNVCEDGHDPCGGDPVRHFDAFLARVVPRIEASRAFGRRGLIIVTWDEGADPPQDPGHVGALLLGPLVRPGSSDRARVNHYGLERTLAEGLGVAALAHARSAAAITSMWR
jgi:hypothetical protein